MSLHRTKATFIGLFEAGRVNEWVVTEKLGDALKTKAVAKAPRKPRVRIGERYSSFAFHSCPVFWNFKINLLNTMLLIEFDATRSSRQNAKVVFIKMAKYINNERLYSDVYSLHADESNVGSTFLFRER